MLLDHCKLKVFIPTDNAFGSNDNKEMSRDISFRITRHLEILFSDMLSVYSCSRLKKIIKSLLSIRKNKIISNVAALCKLVCACKVPRFIHNEPFNLKTWLSHGDNSQVPQFDEDFPKPSVEMYCRV